jgi:hypothetical protein
VRIVEHYEGGSHKLLRVETEGCAVNIVIGLHDHTGAQFTVVEVEARLPDQSGVVWETEGPSVVVVRSLGHQVMHGDSPYVSDEPEPGTSPAPATKSHR